MSKTVNILIIIGMSLTIIYTIIILYDYLKVRNVKSESETSGNNPYNNFNIPPDVITYD